jgi:hypothetical protein
MRTNALYFSLFASRQECSARNRQELPSVAAVSELALPSMPRL